VLVTVLHVNFWFGNFSGGVPFQYVIQHWDGLEKCYIFLLYIIFKRPLSPISTLLIFFGAVQNTAHLLSCLHTCWLWRSCTGNSPVWARERCRISPSRFLAECCKRQLNQGSFVLLYFRLFTFSDLYWVCLYFPVLFCLSVSVKWLAVKTTSEMTYRPIVSSGALISTPTNQAQVLCGNDSLSSSCRHTCTAVYIFNSHMINFLCYRYHLYYFYCFA